MKYKVVFRGKVDNDFSLDDILENVSNLFDQSTEEIYQELFEKPQSKYIFIQGLSNEDAQEYQSALLEAGIVADIDLDLDVGEIEGIGGSETVNVKPVQIKKTSVNNVDTVEINTEFLDNIDTPPVQSSDKSSDIRQRFLQTQEFTLLRNTNDVVELETNRVEKLKNITKKRHEELNIDDRDRVAIPPYFHSGVRIGRVRFIYRIVLALALVTFSLNIAPIYLVEHFGNSGYYFSFLINIIVFMLVLMVISQRFCDFDEVSIAKMLSITTVLGILVFSIFVHNYYIIQDAAIEFSRGLLNTNNLGEELFKLNEILNAHIARQDDQIILKRVDSYVKWLTYGVVAVGSIILLSLPGAKGNNHYGRPSPQVVMVETIIFMLSLVLLIFGFTYPYSSIENKYQNRLYKTEFYEYIGMLKPLPGEFEAIYKEYLKKNSTK